MVMDVRSRERPMHVAIAAVAVTPPTTLDAVGRSVVVDQCGLKPDHFTRRLPTQTGAPSLPTARTPSGRD